MSGAAPPPGADRLLRLLLPDDGVGESMLGDLRQEYDELRALPGSRVGVAWYWRQALRLILGYRARQVGARLGLSGLVSRPLSLLASLDALVQDLRFGTRVLRSSPGLSAVAVATLALGIGANSALFSVVNAVLLQPLRVPAADRLIALRPVDLPTGRSQTPTAPGVFTAWAAESTSFGAMTAMSGGRMTLTGRGEATLIAARRAAGGFFETAATPPLLGRTFTAEDDALDARVAVISHGLWQRLFGGDPDVLQESLQLNGVAFRIIGVMPSAFRFLDDGAEVWAPSGWSPEYRRQMSNYAHEVIGRLRPDVTIDEARAEMERLTADLRARYPAAAPNLGVEVRPLSEVMRAESSPALLLVLGGAVAMVLLIACVNLASLLLARAHSRRGEIAVRAALGATRGRIAVQVLAEAMLLAALGGVAGLALAAALLELAGPVLPVPAEALQHARLDLRALLFTGATSMLAGMLFGVLPALQLSRDGARHAARDAGRRTATDGGGLWNALVVAEVALAVVLLVGSGLLLRSFVQLWSVERGFPTDGLITFRVNLPSGAYEPESAAQLWNRLRDELTTIPGVEQVSGSNQLPASRNRVSGWFDFADRPVPERDRAFLVPYRVVLPGYFETLEIPLVAGRTLALRDAADPGVVINEAARQRFWGDADPIGDRITLGPFDGDPWIPPATVVGVVRDVRNDGLDSDILPEITYLHDLAPGWTALIFVARVQGDPASFLTSARDRVAALESAAPIDRVLTVNDIYAAQVADERSVTLLTSAFALVGLVLAAIGVFGLLSYTVGQRTQEMGIRLALGARAPQVRGMVIAQAGRRVGLGLAIGIVGSWGLGRFLSGLLFGVAPGDPLTLAGSALLLAAVALLAAYLPARRAARVPPVEALRAH